MFQTDFMFLYQNVSQESGILWEVAVVGCVFLT